MISKSWLLSHAIPSGGIEMQRFLTSAGLVLKWKMLKLLQNLLQKVLQTNVTTDLIGATSTINKISEFLL